MDGKGGRQDSLLPRSDLDGQSTDLAVLVGGVTVKGRPVVKDGLGEGLSTGSLSQVGVEAERLGDGQVGCSVSM